MTPPKMIECGKISSQIKRKLDVTEMTLYKRK